MNTVRGTAQAPAMVHHSYPVFSTAVSNGGVSCMTVGQQLMAQPSVTILSHDQLATIQSNAMIGAFNHSNAIPSVMGPFYNSAVPISVYDNRLLIQQSGSWPYGFLAVSSANVQPNVHNVNVNVHPPSIDHLNGNYMNQVMDAAARNIVQPQINPVSAFEVPRQCSTITLSDSEPSPPSTLSVITISSNGSIA